MKRKPRRLTLEERAARWLVMDGPWCREVNRREIHAWLAGYRAGRRETRRRPPLP
jgi:hypothetical protein